MAHEIGAGGKQPGVRSDMRSCEQQLAPSSASVAVLDQRQHLPEEWRVGAPQPLEQDHLGTHDGHAGALHARERQNPVLFTADGLASGTQLSKHSTNFIDRLFGEALPSPSCRTVSVMQNPRTFSLGNVRLQSGAVLNDAQVTFATYGTLNAKADNVVLLPTFFTGTHIRNEPLFGPGRAIDPARHFIVSVNLFGNGYSSSPSNSGSPQVGPGFPHVTMFDNVACQHLLLTEGLGVRKIALVLGWSMAAMQAYQWAAQYPDMVEAILPYCGSARCSALNYAFLDGPKAALQADAAWNDGNYTKPPEKGLRAFGRVYVAWAYSHRFFAEELYRQLGFATLEEFVQEWENDHLRWDANNLLAKIWTWQNADISDNDIYRSDFKRALQSIRARAIVMPCSTDQYFVPEDNAAEVVVMPRAELRVFDSPWGHCVASPGRLPAFQQALDEAAAELLRG